MNEDLIKQEFIREKIEKDVRAIFEAQLLISRERIYTRTKYSREGRSFYQEKGFGKTLDRDSLLLKALESPQYKIEASGHGIISISNIPLYMRFMDMKRVGNWQIYNRQVWGILYNNTLHAVRYEYGKEVRERIYAQLQDVFPKNVYK
jgi:hypothetical protein|nr:MAG TPA: hypothetical protein [Caudoviricetes sp.]